MQLHFLSHLIHTHLQGERGGVRALTHLNVHLPGPGVKVWVVVATVAIVVVEVGGVVARNVAGWWVTL